MSDVAAANRDGERVRVPAIRIILPIQGAVEAGRVKDLIEFCEENDVFAVIPRATIDKLFSFVQTLNLKNEFRTFTADNANGLKKCLPDG